MVISIFSENNLKIITLHKYLSDLFHLKYLIVMITSILVKVLKTLFYYIIEEIIKHLKYKQIV